MVKVQINKVIKDGVLQTDLYTEDEILLLSKGKQVTSDIYALIENIEKSNLYLYQKIEYGDIDAVKFDKIIKFDEQIKQRAVQTIDYIYKSTDVKTSVAQANELSDILVDTVTSDLSVSISLDELKCSDEYTFKHSLDVASMAVLLGRELGLDHKALKELAVAGLMHDVGKTKIPNEIINKPDKLTDEEFAIMKKHPIYSYEIVKDTTGMSEVSKMAVLQHHEKWNGAGYPWHVKGYNINYYARILAVADVFDALVTDRPYHKHFTPSDAIEIMQGMVDSFDLKILKVFLHCIILYPVGSLVALSNGDTAVVLENNKENILRPLIRTINSKQTMDLANDLKCASILITGAVDDYNADIQENAAL